MIHQESLKLNDIQSTNSNDQLIIIGLQKQIADLEQCLEERKGKTEDLYHREKAEALISKLHRDEEQAKKEVNKEGKKLAKASAACRKRQATLDKQVT